MKHKPILLKKILQEKEKGEQEQSFINSNKEILSGYIRFKKRIITVFGQPELAAELAFVAAKKTDFNILLIDLDLLNPTMDLLLNVPKISTNIISFDNPANNTGLNICLDAADKNVLSRELLLEAVFQKTKNLHVLTGNYIGSNYPQYTKESLEFLLKRSYELYDLTIISCNKWIHDYYTAFCLLHSDFNLLGFSGDSLSLREMNGYVETLHHTIDFPIQKMQYIAFEYDKRYHYSEKIIKELIGDNYAGLIHHSDKRIKYRNLKAPYAKNMEENILRDYIYLLSKFDIVPRPRLLERLSQFWTFRRKRKKKKSK